MAAVKKVSISQANLVMLKVSNINRPQLAALELELMKERGATDCLDISNTDIINDAILTAYKIKCRRKK